jgi:hypothetical protein
MPTTWLYTESLEITYKINIAYTNIRIGKNWIRLFEEFESMRNISMQRLIIDEYQNEEGRDLGNA